MIAIVSWVLLAEAAKAQDCYARAWEPLGLQAPCADKDQTNPPPQEFERTWNLSPDAAALAARAWALGTSALSAPAWLQVVRAAPQRFEPIAAMSIRAWRAPSALLTEALAASAAPFDNARRILAGFAARHIVGDATPAIYRWLLERGPPGMAAIADAGLERSSLGVVVGLAGLAHLDTGGKNDAARGELSVKWARVTLAVAIMNDLYHLAAQIYRTLGPATRERIIHDGGGDDPRRALAAALLLEGAPELALALARARGSSPTIMTGGRADTFPVPCADFLSMALREDRQPWSADDLFQVRVSLRRCQPWPAALALLGHRLPADGGALAKRYLKHIARLERGRLAERPDVGAVELAREWKRVHDESALEVARYRRLAEESSARASAQTGELKFPLALAPSASTPFEAVGGPAESKGGEPAPTCPDLPDDFERVTARNGGDGRCLVIAISQALDPTGEATGGGYWLFREREGGGWERGGIYLGLRQWRPYRITPDGHASLENGILRLAARRREIDESSLHFPPTSTNFRAEGGPLTLQINMETLVRDSDGDGIADLEEERMLLDPQQEDSDGDGVRDGDDAFPNVPNRGPAARDADLMTAVLAEEEAPVTALMTTPGAQGAFATIRVEGRHKVTFVLGDPRQFVGVRATSQVVVLRPAEATAAMARFGTFYPTTLDIVVHPRGTQAVVWRDSQWTGGTYLWIKSEGTWSLKSVQSWVS